MTFPTLDSSRVALWLRSTPSVVRAWLLAAAAVLGLGSACQAQATSEIDQPLTSAHSLERVEASIAYYQRLAEQVAWKPAPRREVSSDAKLSEKQREWTIGRLLVTGELKAPDEAGAAVSEGQLARAIQDFQRRHGLLPDGKIWPATWQALNTSPQDRARQLEQSLTELKRLAKVIKSGRYLLVNIPAFEVMGIRDGQIEIQSAVVVGKRRHQTPVLDTTVRAVNFHPRWHVPPSIVASRLFPALRKDPHFLAKESYELFHAASRKSLTREEALDGLAPGQVMFEKPAGPRNPLGRIRLDMPNSDAIFLHDSPQTWLFARPVRAISAGCVRVARIVELTAWLLEETPYGDLDELGKILRSFEPQTVTLEQPVPIHLAYVSAWVDVDGRVQYRNDIYGRRVQD